MNNRNAMGCSEDNSSLQRSKIPGSKSFQWCEEHDVFLCREILVCEPFYLKPRSPERGKTWEKIATNLNMLHTPNFRVTSRSCRDRCTLLTTKYAQKISNEEKASGIDVEETELGRLLEEILEKEKLGKEQIESENEKKKSKAEKDKITAESVRDAAMRRMQIPSKKKSESDDTDNEENADASLFGRKRTRRSVGDAIGYLKDKADKDYAIRMEEINIKKKELEAAAENQKAKAEREEKFAQQQQGTMLALLKQMQQQQHDQQNLQAMFIAQQQQQNKILMALMDRNSLNLN